MLENVDALKIEALQHLRLKLVTKLPSLSEVNWAGKFEQVQVMGSLVADEDETELLNEFQKQIAALVHMLQTLAQTQIV